MAFDSEGFVTSKEMGILQTSKQEKQLARSIALRRLFLRDVSELQHAHDEAMRTRVNGVLLRALGAKGKEALRDVPENIRSPLQVALCRAIDKHSQQATPHEAVNKGFAQVLQDADTLLEASTAAYRRHAAAHYALDARLPEQLRIISTEKVFIKSKEAGFYSQDLLALEIEEVAHLKSAAALLAAQAGVEAQVRDAAQTRTFEIALATLDGDGSLKKVPKHAVPAQLPEAEPDIDREIIQHIPEHQPHMLHAVKPIRVMQVAAQRTLEAEDLSRLRAVRAEGLREDDVTVHNVPVAAPER